MIDPFGDLRSFRPDVEGPDPERIKARAAQIRAGRARMVGVAAALLLVSASAVLLFPESERKQTGLATPARPPVESSPQALEGGLASGASPSAGSEVPSSGAAPAQSHGEPAPVKMGGSARLNSSGARLRLEIELSGETASTAMPTVMRLKVCNDQLSTVTVQFETQQRYDFEIVRPSDGTLVWRWGATKRFEAAPGSETFQPGCRIFAEESWGATDQQGGQAPPGEYRVTGMLTLKPSLRSEPKRVCAIACP